MPDVTGWLVLLSGALVGSVVGGIAGFGAGIILLPLVAWILGIHAVAPVLTVTMLLGNLSRLWWSRHEVDRAVALRFLAGAVPTTLLGAAFYAGAATEWLRWIIGAFLIAAVPLRRLLLTRRYEVRLRHFPWIGAGFGALSSVVVTIGAVLTPFYLAYGLRRSAYIATEAACALGMHLVRGAAFTRYALIGWDTLAVGIVLGTTMFAGSWVARRLLERISEGLFLRAVEALLLLLGLHFLFVAG